MAIGRIEREHAMCGLFGRVDNDRIDEKKRREEPHICGRVMVEVSIFFLVGVIFYRQDGFQGIA